MRLDRETFARMSSAYTEALAIPPGDRAAFVESRLGSIEPVREIVMRALDSHAGEPALLRPGDVLGGYTILARIGVGGMGVVYSARQPGTDREVALKIPLDPQHVERIADEARAMARLNHPGIAQVHEARADARPPFLAMELVRDASTILQHARDARLDPRSRVELLARACEAAGYAHERGVAHRDLKPANILVDSDGAVKIVDFGIARIVDAATERASRAMGTLAYLSPERAGGARGDARSDVYSMGVVLRELVSVHPAPRAARARRALPWDLDAVIAKALEADPLARYATATDLAADLRRGLDGRGALAAKLPRRAWSVVRRHRRAAGGVGAAALVIGLSLAVASRSARRAEDARRSEAREAYASRIIEAAAASRRGDAATARRCLDQCPAEARGWEWRRLRRTIDQSKGIVAQLPRAIRAVAASADGSLVAAASHDPPGDRIHVWTTGDWNVAREFVVEPGIRSLAARPDGRRFAYLTDAGLIGELDLETGIITASSGFSAIAYDESGRLVRVDAQGVIDVDGVASALGPAPGSGEAVAMALSPTARVALARSDGTAWIGSTREGWRSVSLGAPARCLAWDLLGERLAFGCDDGTVRVWDPRLESIQTLAGHKDAVLAIAAALDGALLTGSADRMLGRHAAPWTDARFQSLLGHDHEILGIGVLADGRVVTGGSDGQLRAWRPGEPRADAGNWSLDARCAAFHPDGASIAVGSGDGTLRIIDARSGSIIAQATAHDSTVNAVAFSNDGSRLLSAGGTTPRLWDRKLRLARELIGADRPVQCAAFGDGRVAAGSDDRAVRVWSAHNGALEMTLPHPHAVGGVSFSLDGSRLATASGREARVFDARTGRERLRFEASRKNSLSCIAFSPDSRQLLTCGYDELVRVWDARDGRPIAELRAHVNPVSCASWNRAGTRLVTCSRGDARGDGQVRLWDTLLWRELLELSGSPADWTWTGFSPDGERILAADLDRRLAWWDAAPE